MNKYERKLLWCAFVAYMSAPAIVNATPWNTADFEQEPLWLGTSVQHNLMFGLDDSGSMDSEVLFDNNDGALYLNDDGFFADATGNLHRIGGAPRNKFVYLFPNGTGGYSGGKRMYSDHYAIPPVAAYAFARSPAYNKAYYDPNETYVPWPNYASYTETFDVPDPTNVEFEAYSSFGSGTINLLAELDNGSAGWTFDGDATATDNSTLRLVCDNAGTPCASGSEQIKYYPATYYLKQDTGSYYYNPTGALFGDADSVLLEAENRTVLSPFLSGADLVEGVKADNNADEITAFKSAAASVSESNFVGTLSSAGSSMDSAPIENSLSLVFSPPKGGSYKVWIRMFGRDDSHNSFWMNMSGAKNFVPGDPLNVVFDGDWHQLRYGTPDNATWQWVEWGQMDLTGGTHTLEMRRREGGAYVDQVLITSTGNTPTGIVTIDAETRSCATDIAAAHYQDFVKNPSYFQTSSLDTTQIDGIGYDGACLKKYEIWRSGAGTDLFDNGGSEVRTNAEEADNFATWFKYYRRRHQAMRGAVASSLQNINDVRVGLYWINSLSGDVTMRDWTVQSEVNTFLDEHFGHVRAGGTPLRNALNYAGEQYEKHAVDADGNITTPVVSECQRNYTLLFTDGYNSDGAHSIGDADGAADSPYKDSDSSGTLADIAYHFYEDFSHQGSFATGKVKTPSACDNSPDPWLDCKADLHMNTYSIGLGTKGTIFGVTHNTVLDAYDNSPAWPDADKTREPEQVDDLYHAAVNGRGRIFNAESSADLGDAMTQALKHISEAIGSGSGVTFNSSSLQANDGTSLYTTLFNSTDWSGNVSARALLGKNRVEADGSVTPAGTVLGSVWKDSAGNDAGAAELLDERDLSTNDRVILTMDDATTKDGVAFQWSKLTTDQQADLKTGPGVAAFAAGSDEAGQKRLDWIRGDITIPGLRERGSRLGDVIHSAPVYVGRPSSVWPDSDPFGFEGTNANRFTDSKRYSDFKVAQKARNPVLYVGANDGMLHGFDASNNATDGGEELFAYVPSEVYSTGTYEGLHYLTDPNYSHKYYVDLSPVVQDVFMYTDSAKVGNDNDSERNWITMLLGGLRGGGKGLFALDVTDPTSFSEADTNAANTVLWEFNETNAPGAKDNLGYRVSTPAVVRMNNGKWAAIFGNGYDSINGRAVLFIVYLEQGLDGEWTLSDDYMMIDTGVGSSFDKNGLSGVAVADTNGDYVADRAYAGDLKGNMWAFDLTDAPKNRPPAWVVDYSSSPLFTARDSAGNAQAITSAPSLAYNSEGDKANNDPNILVTFGTGSYLKQGDVADKSVQSYYTVWDQSTENLTRYSLTERTLTQTGDRLSLAGQTDANGNVAVPWSMNGWFFDLAPQVVDSNGNTSTAREGERLINKPLLAIDKDVGPVAVFATTIPDDSECSGGGSSVLYAVPLLTGLDSEKPLIDLNGDGVIDVNDLGVGVSKDGLINDPNKLGQIIYGSKGDSEEVDATQTEILSGGEREGRLGWFELIDE